MEGDLADEVLKRMQSDDHESFASVFLRLQTRLGVAQIVEPLNDSEVEADD